MLARGLVVLGSIIKHLFIFKMGNQQTSIISEDFASFVHPSLAYSTLNSDTKELEVIFHRDKSKTMYCQWMTNLLIFPQNQRYLFLPNKIILQQSQSDITDSHYNFAKAIYDPFIYTLKRQIMHRKRVKKTFQERQMWKLLKIGALALRYWEMAHPGYPIGVIQPQNILISKEGKIRFVNQLSFSSSLKQVEKHHYQAYMAPHNRVKETKIQENYQYQAYIPPQRRVGSLQVAGNRIKDQNQHTMTSIYSLGKVLLAVILVQIQYSNEMIYRKQQQLEQFPTLKKLILEMTQNDINKRLTLAQLLKALKDHKDEMEELQQKKKLKLTFMNTIKRNL